MLQFRLIPNDRFLQGEISGLVSIDAWDKMLGELQTALAELPQKRLLLDLFGLLGWLGLPERQAVGALMARRLLQMTRVALVIEATKITGVVEAEAQRSGLELRLFTSHEKAATWLLA